MVDKKTWCNDCKQWVYDVRVTHKGEYANADGMFGTSVNTYHCELCGGEDLDDDKIYSETED